MIFAPAYDTDLSEAAGLINGAYRGDTARRGWTHEADFLHGVRTTAAILAADLARNPAAGLYMLRDGAGDPPLGCVWLEPHEGTVWYLGLLAVRPDLQDRRLGRTLLGQAEAIVRAGSGETIRMTVIHLRDSLIAWYQRRGYRLTGATQPFPFAEPPGLDLHFVVLEKYLDKIATRDGDRASDFAER